MACNYGKPLPPLPAEQIARFHRSYTKGPDDACWDWHVALTNMGYGKFGIYLGKQGHYRHLLAHRLAHYLSTGVDPAGWVVMHSCDNRKCVNPNHLSLGTYKDNSQDMSRKGRAAGADRAGDKHWKSTKLSWELVAEIRQKFTLGNRQCHLAREYGLTYKHIHLIVAGKIWNPKYAPA